MTKTKRTGKGYAIFMAILLLLLIGCIALFVYASAHNGVHEPRLPGKGVFAVQTAHPHG